ncbi:MAG: phosphate acyltransferase [Bacteroidales bacterium]|jgi:phosphate butyryltransferase|nr:phosphate acyltransferase [Bacteroidales bacterium]
MIRTLDQMVEKVQSLNRKHRIAVAWALDGNTIDAVHEAVIRGFAEALLIGDTEGIKALCRKAGIDHRLFSLINSENELAAAIESVRLTQTGEADIVMKGLVGTDVFLREVMDKNRGLMLHGSLMSYVCALQMPAYHKLLFITDTAVIPEPSLEQKIRMAEYAVEMAQRFGISNPKVALISASEKPSRHFRSSADYVEMCRLARSGAIADCIMDGPLDIFLACDKKSVEIKGVMTPVNGDADILLFPSLESSNPFYKGLMLFAGAELAGIIRGTSKPVIVMSRSESERSKFYCIALACLMA